MLGGWLDQLILEVFSNLNDSMILKWLQVTAFSLLCVKKAGKQTDKLQGLLETMPELSEKSGRQELNTTLITWSNLPLVEHDFSN